MFGKVLGDGSDGEPGEWGIGSVSQGASSLKQGVAPHETDPPGSFLLGENSGGR